MDSLRKPASRPTFVSRPALPLPNTPPAFTPPPLPTYARRGSKETHSSVTPWFKGFLLLCTFLFLLALSYGGFIIFKGYSLGQSIQIENKNSSSFLTHIKDLSSTLFSENRTPLQGETDGRINILLLGRAGEHYPGKNLTDTVMMMSIDTRNKKIALLSLPRDLYAPIAETGFYTKLNSIYQYGITNNEGIIPLKKTIENITGQNIHYFFTIDFDGFEKVINTLGGIQVDVVRDFYDTRYPGKNYSYETFEIKKGWQTLDGATALKYVRERHDDPEGDFGRAKRQQQVIQAVKDKAFSLGTLVNVFALNDLFNTLGENIKTDMSVEEMESFLDLAKKLDTKNVTSLVIDAWQKDSLLRVSHVLVGNVNAFILVPRVGNWNEIIEVSQNIFHLDELKDRKAHIATEKPTLTVLYPQNTPQIVNQIKDVTEEMGFENISFSPVSLLTAFPEKSMIMDRSNLSKPFSLDELLRKFSLTKTETLPVPFPSNSQADFILFVGSDLADSLSALDNTVSQENLEESPSTEILPPQPKPKKKH